MIPHSYIPGFPGGSDGKESACNVGDLGFVPGLGRFPGGGYGNPLQHSGLENPLGQRSLAGCSPWGHKESDTTERLSTAHSYTPLKLNMFSTFCVPALSISSFFGCWKI